MYFFYCLSIGVLVVFCEGGGILFIPTAASEDAINASWLIILGVGMIVLGFPVLRVPFGIWVPLQRGLVL